MLRHYYAISDMTDYSMIRRGGGRHLLVSYAYFKKFQDQLIADKKAGKVHLMADSGAFTNYSRPGHVTCDGYIEWLKEYKHLFDQYISFDNLRSRDATIKNYEKIRKEGLNPLFVDHMVFREGGVLKPFYKTGEKLAWGGMVHYKPPGSSNYKLTVGLPPVVRKRIEKRSLMAKEAPTSHLHLLGVGMKIAYFLPWFPIVDTFDSTAWCAPGKFGRDYLIRVNEQGWPKLAGARDQNDIDEVRKKIRSSGFDPDVRNDRNTYAVKVLEKFFGMLWDRYQKAVKAKETLEVGMHKEDDDFGYSEEDSQKVWSYVVSNLRKEEKEEDFDPVIARVVEDEVPLEKRDLHDVSGRGAFFRPHNCYYALDFPKTKKLNGPKCGEPASKAIIWADGRAFVPVCEKHLEAGSEMLKEANGEWACIVGDRDLPRDREEGIKWWHQSKKDRAWHKEKYPSFYEKIEKGHGVWGSPAGKAKLASEVVEKIPDHKVYVEPFAGGAAVFYRKEKSEKEVLSDLNENIALSFAFVRDITEDQIKQLKNKDWTVSKEVARKVHELKPSNNLDTFYRFVYKRRALFMSNDDRITAIDPKKAGKKLDVFPSIYKAKERLKDVKVYSESYEKVLSKYDSKDTFFYLDPPYPNAAQECGEDQFDEDKFIERLKSIKGKFFLHYEEKGIEKFKAVSGWEVERIRTAPMMGSDKKVNKYIEVRNYQVTNKSAWSRKYINDLPDSAFLYIEPGGEKDEEGKTEPRVLRRWPVRDHEGNLDIPHLRNAIARIPQSKVPLSAAELKRYQEKARDLLEETQKADSDVQKIIEHRSDGMFCVMSENGKRNFGCYKTLAEAKERLRQVEYFSNQTSEKLLKKSVERIPIIKTKDERYVLGIVLEPNDGKGDVEFDPDTQKDIYSIDEVRQTAQRFMEDFQNIGLMHRQLVNGKVKILESFLSPIEFLVSPEGVASHESELGKEDKRDKYQEVRKGTWLLGLRIVDDSLWKEVKAGKLGGLSVGGSARRIPA